MSVAFTVRAMDAGPIVAQQRVAIDPSIQAPQLLDQLFDCGTDLFLNCLPQVWSGDAASNARQQASYLAPSFGAMQLMYQKAAILQQPS